ncbi:hypothetical protein SAMN06265375_1011557 [Muriicola jejuensis]|uniref:DUF4179 domain-containing protein n=1 Tax=Muriicola jejuensis TaxID=504488 RepID=A0A6P0UCB7_9FLAO|nr:DUF3379 domain-containing protein [Muriicola jejuensis]NER08963.1 hypothetical protein [Muriicola jejuensis]SMP12604.1 hypothetical protein SAMN06265375_1011557 [Muriicola jejuensis]
MKERDLQDLFREIKPALDREEPPMGHQQRFLSRLEAKQSRDAKGVSWWKPLAIAASVLFLFGIFLGSFTDIIPLGDRLAEVSPEVSNTERYFAGVIEQQLTLLEQEDTPEARKMVSDAMIQLDLLEADYQKLRTDLLEGGDQKILLSAIVQNFQMRIDLLKDVMEKLETVKKLKVQENEDSTL